MPPQFPLHNPESALIASHQRILEDLMEGQKNIMEKLEQLPVILAEVRRTNGRVTKLEEGSVERLQRLARLETEHDQSTSTESNLQAQIDAKTKTVEASVSDRVKSIETTTNERIRQVEMIIGLLIAMFVGYLGGLSMVVVGHLQQDVIRTPQDIIDHMPKFVR
jgi:hypothetical protein